MKKIKPKKIKREYKPIYYYLRDIDNNPIITVCIIKNIKGQICRGVAICRNELEQPLDIEGRNKAFGRAKKALYRKKCTEPINREETNNRIRDLLEINSAIAPYNLFFKSDFNANPSNFEKSLFGKLHRAEQRKGKK
jgi:hypothetical protein